MKVAIREQIDIEDSQRVQLADILDAKQSKRQATREEIKDFAWALGSEWAEALAARWAQLFGEGQADETAESGTEENPVGDGPTPRVHAEDCALADDHAGDCDALTGDEDEDLLGMSTEEAMEALL